jgi:hypothetical protein
MVIGDGATTTAGTKFHGAPGHDNSRRDDNGRGQSARAAPGPIVGAGLPALAVRPGVYWLIRRRRKPE